MKPHLEERNKRIREEYFRRIGKGETLGAVIDEISEREKLTFETALQIVKNPHYGNTNKSTPAQKRSAR